MSNLVAVIYPDEATAKAAVETLRSLSAQYLIEMEDLVYITKNEKGKVQLHQAVNLTAAGMANGAFWGMLIGLIFLIPIGGLIMGAVMGAVGGKLSDYGIDDKFAKEVGEKVEPGKAAVFIMVRKATLDKVLPEMSKHGGEILSTNLSDEAEAKIQAALTAGGTAQA